MINFIDTWIDKIRTPGSLSLVAVVALFLCVWLNAVQSSLSLDATTSFELFLSADDTARSALLGRWRELDVRLVAAVALAVDLAFIPAYGFFFLMFARAMHGRLTVEGAPTNVIALFVSAATLSKSRLLQRLAFRLELRRTLVIATSLLMLVDLVEDVSGLLALGGIHVDSMLRRFHAAKEQLALICTLLALGILAVWAFEIGQAETVTGEPARPTLRPVFRRDAADILWRSRYAIATMAIFAGLVLVMNQGQDVLVGIASAESATETLYAIVASVVSVWLFSYASYLWPRILCLTRRPSNLSPIGESPDSQTVAKWWPRLLGATPLVMLTILCGHAAQTSFSATPKTASSGMSYFGTLFEIPPVGMLLLTCATACTLLAAGFMWIRAAGPTSSPRRSGGYFEVLDRNAARDEVMSGPYRILFVIPRATVTLIPVSLAGVGLLRWWSLGGTQAPLALAAIGMALALWSSVLGQVSALALRRSTPWVLIATAVSGVLGSLGLTDNQRVAVYDASVEGMTLYGMSVAAIALGSILALFGVSQMLMTRAQAQQRRGVQALCVGLVAGLTAAVLYISAQVDGQRSRDPIVADRQLKMDLAIRNWLVRLCDLEPDCLAGRPGEVQAYVVSSEGGGIRAAYWTALVLAELTLRKPAFAERTFSISSVSGGSLGAAAYRACLSEASRGETSSSIDESALQTCVRRLGAIDLLTPLLSSWLFEDVMSRIVPTGWCARPGCGFMSRGLWFERVLEQRMAATNAPPGTQTMSSPLNGIHEKPDLAAAFAPHLFLNATAVESGERAIASDIAIASAVFPNARDQQDELGSTLKLSTAAHNSARFPYVNALGSVTRIDGSQCLYGKDGGKDGAFKDSARQRGERPLPDCLHLADGGYFDNSGAHTSQDIVHALRRFLLNPSVASTKERDAVTWMQGNLRLTGVFLRFGEQSDVERARCQPPEEAKRQADATVSGAERARQPDTGIAVSSDSANLGTGRTIKGYDPTIPSCQGPLKLYSDFLGPAVAAKNVGGTGAGGRLAESRLIGALQEFNRRPHALDASAAGPDARQARPMVALELRSGRVLYPLGWYLSPQAREEMQFSAPQAVAASLLP